jgi:hypothetical protein
LAHSKRVLFRATLQYYVVLNSVTLALSCMTIAFVLKKRGDCLPSCIRTAPLLSLISGIRTAQTTTF